MKEYDFGLFFDLGHKVIYLMAQVPINYPRKPAIWTVYDNCAGGCHVCLEHVNDSAMKSLTKQLMYMVVSVCSKYALPYPHELASLSEEDFNEFTQFYVWAKTNDKETIGRIFYEFSLEQFRRFMVMRSRCQSGLGIDLLSNPLQLFLKVQKEQETELERRLKQIPIQRRKSI
nr:hypothetical transcript [Hymenolepis microstoma]